MSRSRPCTVQWDRQGWTVAEEEEAAVVVVVEMTTVGAHMLYRPDHYPGRRHCSMVIRRDCRSRPEHPLV